MANEGKVRVLSESEIEAVASSGLTPDTRRGVSRQPKVDHLMQKAKRYFQTKLPYK